MKRRITQKMLMLAIAVFGLSYAAPLWAQDPIWSDEFDGTSIDKSIWSYNVGGDGNGNGELQYYTAASENSYLEDGNLIIEARKENYEGKQFTSARLRTLGRFAFKYGTLEAKIKLPDLANGLWPAFWLMGNNFGEVGWPQCGEIDILEAGFKDAIDQGTVNRSVSAATHWWHESGDWGDWLQADYSEATTIDGNFYDDYHTYKLDWTPEQLQISVDDNPYLTLDITDPNLSEFNKPAYILLNLAVGGFNFVEITDPAQITAPFPARMMVDYVRLYENDFTEITLGAEMAHRGNYGIFTETTEVNESLNFGASSTHLYVWNNMETSTTAPAEGGDVLSYTVAPGAWWGMGINCADQNMEYYKNGYLHFQCKTTYSGTINVSISSTGADGSGVDLIEGGEQYGLERDGQWHEVAIPLYKFSNVDFTTVKMPFAVSGGDPGAAMDIAFDDIYWSESIAIPTPEYGNYAVYSEDPANSTAGSFGFGVSGDLFVWENTLEFTDVTPAEGNSALSFKSTGAGWYGLGLTARVPHNLSAFNNEDGALHFAMKTSANVDFRVGLKSGNVDGVGQKWIWFRNGNDPYGFVRDGQWHEIVIPIADIASDVDLMNVTQMFQLLGTTEISDIAFDNIYFSGGKAAEDPGSNETPINRAPSAAITASVSGGPAPLNVMFDASQSFDVNGDELTYNWIFGDGTVGSGAVVSHTYTQNGSYEVALTVSDGSLSDVANYTIFVNDNFGSTKSAKRGLSNERFSEADMAALAPGMSWWYNWGTQPEQSVSDVHLNYGVDFVPMAWDERANDQQIIDWLQNHPEAKYILGWNEPNFIDQAALTPSEAAAEWPRLEAIAEQFNLEIVSPAMNYCGNCVSENGTTYYDPIEYMDDFFEVCPDCKVDAIAIHSYMGTVGAFEWYVDLFKKYDRPIWVTEFCNWENDPTYEDQKRFMIHAVDYLENDPDVAKYAWFIGRHQGAPYMSLLEQQSGVLTELGQMYINMPVHDPSVYYNVPGLIEAEQYATMNGVRPEETQDVNGFLDIAEIESGDWTEYRLNAEQSGSYNVSLRVKSATGGTINVLVDGAQLAAFNVSESTDYINVDANVDLANGNHTLRLVYAQGSFNVNTINFTQGGDNGNSAPIANFTSNVTSGTSPLNVSFDASTSTDADGDALTYSWDFGDGQTATGVNASHTFTAVGVYQVVLTVNDGAASTTKQLEITVNDSSTPIGDNLALNKAVTSSTNDGGYIAENVNDGDAGSRWASTAESPSWVKVDLAGTYSLNAAVLNWERASAESYLVMISSVNSIPDPNSADWTVVASKTGMEDVARVDELEISASGRYLAVYATNKLHPWGYSLWELEVYGEETQVAVCGDTNIALNKAAASSSIEGGMPAASAFDGDGGTRWGSGFSDDEWVRVDLGAAYNVCEVILTWEAAYGTAYEIRLGNSTDINASSVIATVTNSDGGQDLVDTDNSVSGRYLWMKGISRATGYGYSLWEMEVHGALASGAARIGNEISFTQEVSVYPNPVYKTLNILLPSVKAGDQIQITSLTGKEVITRAIDSAELSIDVADLTPGVYLLKVTGAQKKIVRFIKR